MRTLRNYVILEVLRTFALCMVMVTFVLLIGNLIKLVDLIVNKGVEIGPVLKLLAYFIPWLLTFSLPISLLSATLLVFGRMSADNEITAMQTSGINLFRIFIPVIFVGFLSSLFTLYLDDEILPNSRYQTRRLIKEIGIKKPTAYIEPGMVIKEFDNYIIFVQDMDGDVMKNIKIYQPQEKGTLRTIVAQRAMFLPSKDNATLQIKLFDGTSEEILDPSQPRNFFKLNFKTYYITLNLKEVENAIEIGKKVKEYSFRELFNEIDSFNRQGIDTTALVAQLHKKFAMAFSSLAFVLIALPLGITARRSEKSVGFGISLGLAIFYWLLLAAGQAMAMRAVIPPWICMWAPNMILTAIGLALMIGKKR